MFTPGQYRLLTALRRRAWAAECARTGIAPNRREKEDAWYRQVLWSKLHVRTSKGCNRAIDFDLVCLGMAEIAGDDREITYWSTAATRRFVHLIRGKLDEISGVTGLRYDWPYVVGILKHMGLPDSIEDVPAELMRNVLIALDTHHRRLREARHLCEDGSAVPIHHSSASEAELPF